MARFFKSRLSSGEGLRIASNLALIFVQPVILVETGLEVRTALYERFGGRAILDFEDHHHSRAAALLVAERPDVSNVDIGLLEKIGRLLLDRLGNGVRGILEEPNPGDRAFAWPSVPGKAECGEPTQ